MSGLARRFRPRTIIILALAAVVLAALGAATIWRLSLAAKNRARLQAIGARGEPVDSIALNQSYAAVPANENAALVWLNGASTMTAGAADVKTWQRLKLPERASNVVVTNLEFLRGIVISNEAALAMFQQAALLPKSRYPVDLTPGINALLPHLSRLRNVTKLLQAEAVVAIEDRDTDRAVGALETMLAQGRSLAPEPLLISQIVRSSINGSAFKTAEFMVNRVTLADSQLRRLQAAFAASEETNALYRALIGERAAFVMAIRNPQTFLAVARPAASQSVSESFQHLAWGLIHTSGLIERDVGFGLDVLTTNIAFSRLPDPDRFASRTNWTQVETRLHNGYYFISAVFLPSIAKAIQRDTEDRARMRLAQTAIAVERFRLAEKRLPDSLDALVPKYAATIPMDPFDGRPLRLKPLPTGCVVYSVGKDAKDDAGLQRSPHAKETDTWDITFTLGFE